MSAAPLHKIAGPIERLLPRLELDAEGMAALAGAADAATAAERLRAAGRAADEVRLFANALPKREAVWWACMCARAIPDGALPPADLRALEAAEQWVRRPEEAQRRAAALAAEATTFQSPEAWAAQAAAWSGGSLAPEGQPVVPPADHLCAIAVVGAVRLAAARGGSAQETSRVTALFVASARDIASGGAGRIEVKG